MPTDIIVPTQAEDATINSFVREINRLLERVNAEEGISQEEAQRVLIEIGIIRDFACADINSIYNRMGRQKSPELRAAMTKVKEIVRDANALILRASTK